MSIDDGEPLIPPPVQIEPITANVVVEAVSTREFLAWILWVVTADLLIFRTVGWTGLAAFFAFAPILFWLGCRFWERWRIALVIAVILELVACRLAWSGDALMLIVGSAFLFGLARAIAGEFPLIIETAVFAVRSWIDGLVRIFQSRQRVGSLHSPTMPDNWSGNALIYPILATITFASIFVFANPDLYDKLFVYFDNWSSQLWSFVSRISKWEIPFCLLALVVGAGLMRPLRPLFVLGPRSSFVESPSSNQAPAPLYAAFRNTLCTLIVLFAIYLCFEFTTMWRREFPTGFYYAGYAHQGAAWLTLALALATAILSYIFSEATRGDPRRNGLQQLAWIWSAQNFLLAAAVYNRLAIYIGYNGMTRMRTIGIFGITVVVVGLCLVLIKIKSGRSFWWLVRSQLVALFLTIAVYSVFPVDYVAHRYNSEKILAGRLHPSVMIAVKPIADEGIFPLLTLVNIEDHDIREGVKALLAQRQADLEMFSVSEPWHWTRFQGAKSVLYRQLQQNESSWAEYRTDLTARQNAIDRFKAYAMQWY